MVEAGTKDGYSFRLDDQKSLDLERSRVLSVNCACLPDGRSKRRKICRNCVGLLGRLCDASKAAAIKFSDEKEFNPCS